MMGYYDDVDNVEEYIQLAEGYDGRAFVPVLRQYLSDSASVLELGMGPGKDFELLNEHFQVTGSDRSAVFVDRYRREHPGADLIQLDAVTLDTDRIFDAIYSNKVLYHLTTDELRTSLRRQMCLLNPDGILFHTFWYGDKAETFSGLRFVYYTESTFADVVGDLCEVFTFTRYTEMEPDDSFYVVLRRKEL